MAPYLFEVGGFTSLAVFLHVFIFPLSDSQNLTCNPVDWSSTYGQESLSRCDDISYEYINGFNRLTVGSPDTLNRLRYAQCCQVPAPYYSSGYTVKYADWTGSMSQNNRWSTCPTGYFLTGIFHTASSSSKLNNIQRARCTKPNGHPYSYKRCIDKDISSSFSNAGLTSCDNGYFITALFRSNCDELKCITKMRCCALESIPQNFDSVNSFKKMVMDFTLQPLAFLAHYMGFSWCSGCRGTIVGEDFNLANGDVWTADTSGACDGYRATERLKIKYDDWTFRINEVNIGKISIISMESEVIDSGSFINTGFTTSLHKVAREVQMKKTLAMSTTSTFSFMQELGLSLNLETFQFNTKSTFGFSTEQEMFSQEEDSNTFHIESSKELQPFSRCDWTLFQAKTKTSVPYSLSMQAKFSVSLTGFMRYSGGYYNKFTNYHSEYRGLESRPTITYKFGDEKVTFYRDLKIESTQNLLPWMWNDMTAAHDWAQRYIDFLTDETLYSFNIIDEFEEVEGKYVYFHWNCTSQDSRNKRSVADVKDTSTSFEDKKLIKIKARSVKDDVFSGQTRLAILSGRIKVPINNEIPA